MSSIPGLGRSDEEAIGYALQYSWASSVAQSVKNTPALWDLCSIPGLGRSTATGDNYPLQYSGLENSADYIVHGVKKIQTRLSNFNFHKPVVGLLSIIDCLSDLVSDTEPLLP